MYQPTINLKRRITTLRWILPVGFALVATLYQLVVAKWFQHNFGEDAHYVVEIVFFGTAGPLLAFWVLTLIGKWLEEKERAENKARMSERRLASITAASADAILSLDLDGRIDSWNRGAELLFGYSEASINGKRYNHLLNMVTGGSSETRWLLDTVRKDGYITGHETNCKDVQGKLIFVELTATDLKDIGGESMGTSIVMRDITERKRREEEIKRLNASLNQQVAQRTQELAEKVDQLAHANMELKNLDQSRSEFVSLVSHQIRAPLTNMRGAVERMESRCADINPTCTRMFEILQQQTARLDRLVVDVLSASRVESKQLILQKEPISILPVVEQVVEQARSRLSEREIKLPTKFGLPLVFADRDHISEVLMNLLDNADKYSPPKENVEFNIRASETEVVFSIRDFGPGIPEEDLERVFNKFYRSNTDDTQSVYGYGLGLYVCRFLIESQGGAIWAENHPNGGAVFSFTLPLWRGEDDRTDHPAY